MSELGYILPRHHPSDVYVPQTLQQCEYVFIRNDMVKRPLTPAHSGPFKVSGWAEIFYTVQRGKTMDNISIDRLKPAFLEQAPTPKKPQNTSGTQSESTAPVPLKQTRAEPRVTFPRRFTTVIDI